jgi:hypothetical protein
MGGMAPAKTTTELDVARAVYLAATDGTARLRYPAGADAEEFAAMRRARFPAEHTSIRGAPRSARARDAQRPRREVNRRVGASTQRRLPHMTVLQL